MDPSLFIASVAIFEIGGGRYREKWQFFSSLKFGLFLLILRINFSINFV
jgi:hypothetical protein